MTFKRSNIPNALFIADAKTISLISKHIFLIAITILSACFSSSFAADINWISAVASDWSSPNNWSGAAEPTINDNGYIVNGGTANLTANGEICNLLYLGGANTGIVQMTGGTLSTSYAYVGNTGTGTFNQLAGTHTVAGFLYLGNSTGSDGTYALSGSAQLLATREYVGSSGTGTFNHSSGSNSISGTLYLAYSANSSGTYNMYGNGQLSAATEYIGFSGTGVLEHSVGTNTTTNLYLGNGSASKGTYRLSSTGQLSATNEYIGTTSATALMQQSGGTNTASYIAINTKGTYKLSAGNLQINSGLDNQGTMDFASSVGIMSTTNSIVNFSRSTSTLKNTSSATLTIGANSLLLVPATFNPNTAFAHYSNAGILHNVGTTLTVTSTQRINGTGVIDDPISCQGTIAATAGGFINSNGGLSVSSSGSVNLGTGNLQIDSTTSGMSGGTLTVTNQYVGKVGTGTFTQSAGTNNITSYLYVGSAANTNGNYKLTGGLLNVTGNINIGSSNSAFGTFTQSGGTNTISGSLNLGTPTGSTGTYELSGGTLNIGTISYGLGTVTFNFGGGTLKVSKDLTTSFPLKLTGTNGDSIIDSANHAVALSGILSGSGGLKKIGSGTLTLSNVNLFTGGVNFTAGSVKAVSLNNLGNGSILSFNGGALVFDGVYDPSVRTMTFQSGAAILDTQTNDITLANAIGNSGNGGLTKQGSGTLLLSVSPSYKGATTINGGTIQLATGAILPATTAVTLAQSGTKLDLNGNSQVFASLSGEVDTELKLGGCTLNVGDSTSTIFNGTISSTSAGSILKLGAGSLTFTGSNSYAGTTQINAGVLAVTKAASLPGYNLQGKVIVNSGGALSVWVGNSLGKWTESEINSLQNNAVFSSGSYLAINTSDADFTYGGALRGNMGLAKLGSYTLRLTGAYSYTGKTIIDSGSIIASKPASIPGYNTTGMVSIDPDAMLAVRVGAASGEWSSANIDSLRAISSFSSGSFLGFDTTSNNYSYSSIITGGIGLTKLGTNTLTLIGENTFTGPVYFQSGFIKAATLTNLGAGTILNFNGGGLQFDGVFDPSFRAVKFITGSAVFDTQANNVTFESSVGDGGEGGLTKKGSGTLTLASVPNYKGDTIVNGGILEIAGGIADGYTTLINVQSGTAILKAVNVNKTDLNITTAASSTFEIVNGNHTVGTISGNGITQVDSNATLTAASIAQNTLTIRGGAKIVIAPISSGALGNNITSVPEPAAISLIALAFIFMNFSRFINRASH